MKNHQLSKAVIVAGLSTTGSLLVSQKSAEASQTLYTVQKNDTLSKIASRFKTTVANLVKLNRIKNPNLIFQGQRLTISLAPAGTTPKTANQPSVAKKPVSTSKPVSAKPENTTSTQTKTYQVQSGDTLWGISQKMGVPVATLIASNHGQSLIYPKQILTLPQTSQNVTSTLSTKSTSNATKSTTIPATTASLNKAVSLSLALSKQHIPYVWGGATTKGFDCSGLVSYVYKDAFNVFLPHNTVWQEKALSLITVSQAKPGDVLFWGNKGSSYHDAIYIGHNQYVAAPIPGKDVEVETIDKSFQPSFAGTLVH